LQAAAAMRIAGEDGILTAAENGDKDRVQDFLIADLASVHQTENPITQKSRTALHFSSRAGHLEICKLLIECQADVNAAGRLGCWCDALPLHTLSNTKAGMRFCLHVVTLVFFSVNTLHCMGLLKPVTWRFASS
jgi:hypothetical protein